MEKNIKVKLPEENVEYTFVLPGNRFITYRFIGIKENGRVQLVNVKTNYVTSMTSGWFSSMLKKNLVSKKIVEPEKPKQIKIVEDDLVITKKSEDEMWCEMILRVKSATKAQKSIIERVIGRELEELIYHSEKLRDYPESSFNQGFINRTTNDLIKAIDCMDGRGEHWLRLAN